MHELLHRMHQARGTLDASFSANSSYFDFFAGKDSTNLNKPSSSSCLVPSCFAYKSNSSDKHSTAFDIRVLTYWHRVLLQRCSSCHMLHRAYTNVCTADVCRIISCQHLYAEMSTFIWWKSRKSYTDGYKPLEERCICVWDARYSGLCCRKFTGFMTPDDSHSSVGQLCII